MNISQKDLNLLLLFSVLYEEQSLSKASLRLSLSQPALSHKLNKLRHEFNDPLFVRSGRGLTPTPKAHELAAQACQLSKHIEHFYTQVEGHNFLDKVDDVHIYTTDYIELLLLPELLPLVQSEAPNIRIITHNTGGQLPLKELEQSRCDLAIAGFYQDLPNHLYRQNLREDEFVVLHSHSNQYVKQTLTLETYVQCQHVVTSLTGDLYGSIDKQLKTLGFSRKVVAGVGSFLVLPQIIRHSDFLLTCLRPIAENARQAFSDLNIQTLPLNLPKVAIEQVWHARTQEDPLRQWLRTQIKAILDNY